MIAWDFLNKKDGTVNALSEYCSMRKIINITPDEICDIHNDIEKIRGVGYGETSGVGNVHGGEDVICKSLDKIDVLQRRYERAIEYMQWFEPAWGCLNEKDQYILRECYQKEQSMTSAFRSISDELGFEERHIRRLKDKAVANLTTYLFGI